MLVERRRSADPEVVVYTTVGMIVRRSQANSKKLEAFNRTNAWIPAVQLFLEGRLCRISI